MAAAFLFDPPVECGNYAEWALAITLASGLPQKSQRPIHIRDGDLLFRLGDGESWNASGVGGRLDDSNTMPGLLRKPLRSTLGTHRIHVIYIPDLDHALALNLHAYLLSEPRYMGCYGVNQSLGLHYVLFDCKLVLSYRITEKECLVKHPECVEVVQSLRLFRSVVHASAERQIFLAQGDKKFLS